MCEFAVVFVPWTVLGGVYVTFYFHKVCVVAVIISLLQKKQRSEKLKDTTINSCKNTTN